ncbi:hypothetical protein P170DRAFT_432501 [Aspergillus steynii IBT 23096]|uniref:A-kinase anchor protein 7-like phosphoesterase domain-containing protein n=1 Tax=Aspergillus steynii IBT 23096 TaxID=1392250 RepID=A0A2I2GQ22_9EURO|nr:uncharacterized protein P170DRAFT_432501 [Aspergillus steynii IBT 23096]PLB54974.1 hypothetical protein P170DRAFT_432501 [Aspergillus steynii IBT 23096]
MILFPRPFRPLAVPRLWLSSSIRSYHPQNYHTIMSSPQQQQQQQQQPRKQRPRPPKQESHRGPAKKEKRPQLTHFLCLPLVNSTSLPQLESSLAAFKAEIPRATTHQGQDQSAEPQPLIPDAAIRPVGTLHLTLGVMSLPSKERLDEAIGLLQSLDLVALVREAERIARVRAQGRGAREPALEAPGSDRSGDGSNEPGNRGDEGAPSPFTVSLESLHALPRARAATVLHAAPVDSTSRLYPFCELLRDKFLDAGFLQGEVQKDDAPQQTQQGGNSSANHPSELESRPLGDGVSSKQPAEEPSLLEEMPAEVTEGVAKNSDQPITPSPSKTASRKPKSRPLLLHATVVNTIYIKGRSRGAGGGKSQKNNRYSFDARDLLARYRDYHLDGQSEDGNTSTRGPFVWARDFPIESVCICEMGAKKLDPEGDESGLNARLREKYMAVAERKLDF